MLESALGGEVTDHLGYEKDDPAGAGSGNSRKSVRSKTVLTEVGPVEIEVPRDRLDSFELQIVKKRQRRLSGWTKLCCRRLSRPRYSRAAADELSTTALAHTRDNVATFPQGQ